MVREHEDKILIRDELVRALSELFAGQRFAVLATQGSRQPHLSLMAFAVSEDLSECVFATDRNTRKFANLQARPHAAMLVDNRRNAMSDTAEAAAVTIIGRVDEITGSKRRSALQIFLDRHPQLEGFARSESSALMRLRVESYEIVRRFQQVEVLRLSDG